ncbi:hypothetical protein B0H66DRAFT_565744 [Apodospora peruviana]|uniref:Uncharacterized protein n=1 Tax=Apodospora peruviana TaxID=516989 RepID=A0AAE0HUT5_9PEZI|nr:hypothetical protein B0H66DRAFT_565744 [Apodospora peruviana]
MASSKDHNPAVPEDRHDNSFDTALTEYGTQSSAPGSSPYKRLPLSFNIYYKQWFSSMYQIGEHENRPLFTIQRHGAWGHDKPMIVLHEGDDPKGPVVGTVTKEGLMKHDTVIELPMSPRPGSEGGTIREPLVSDVSMTLNNSRFTFTFDVGRPGKETRRETFEWRISKAIEVRTLDSMAFGWKLVRLGPDQPTVTGRGGPRRARDSGEASDGKEVVAAWSENSGMTLSKIIKFHFLGAGATGELGDDWALMAALSAFRLWKFTSGSISVRP